MYTLEAYYPMYNNRFTGRKRQEKEGHSDETQDAPSPCNPIRSMAGFTNGWMVLWANKPQQEVHVTLYTDSTSATSLCCQSSVL